MFFVTVIEYTETGLSFEGEFKKHKASSGTLTYKGEKFKGYFNAFNGTNTGKKFYIEDKGKKAITIVVLENGSVTIKTNEKNEIIFESVTALNAG